MARITRDDVLHVAQLARLSLSDDELDTFTAQLEAILDHAAKIESLPTEGIEPTAHPIDVGNVWREDVPGVCLGLDEALANAPDAENDMFRVPPP